MTPMFNHASRITLHASRVTRHPSPFWIDFAVVCAIFAVTFVLYGPSLAYPFVWYDADDLLRAIKYSTLDLFSGVASYQYYRPLIFTIWKLILSAWGPNSAPIFHASLIGAHALNAVLLFALVRDLARNPWMASATALLFVAYPFSYQAVTWAIAHQPPPLIFMLACLLIYVRARLKNKNGLRHLAAVACLIAAMLLHESAFVGTAILLLIEAYLVFTRRVPRSSPWPVMYLGVTLLMFGLYASVAKSPPNEETFQPITGLYLLQGLIYPVAMILARVCQPPGCDSVAWLLPTGGLTLISFLLAWRSSRTLLIGLLGVLWFGLGAAPAWAGRDYVYVEYAPRLLYLAGAGASLAIAAAIGTHSKNPSGGGSHLPGRQTGAADLPGVPTPLSLRGASRGARPADLRIESKGWGRAVQAAAVALILVQSGQFVIARQPLHADAFRLLEQENQAMFAPRPGSVLFVNAVELFTYKHQEFPLGWYGVLVSPWHNRLVETLNLRAENADWVIDPAQADLTSDRARLQLEFHGRAVTPEQFREWLAAASDVYRVEALSPNPPRAAGEGELHVFKVAGIRRNADPPAAFIAEWTGSVRLTAAAIEVEAGTPVLNLDWRIDAPIDPGQTVFVHVRNTGGEIVAQADGDPIGGLAPLSSWTPGDFIRERRPLILPPDLPAGRYTVAVGLYDRGSLQRTTPTQTNGISVNDNALIVAQFNHP